MVTLQGCLEVFVLRKAIEDGKDGPMDFFAVMRNLGAISTFLLHARTESESIISSCLFAESLDRLVSVFKSLFQRLPKMPPMRQPIHVRQVSEACSTISR